MCDLQINLRFVSLSRRIQQLIACPHIQSHYEPFLHNVWNEGELDSYLIEITADILTRKDDEGTDQPIVDVILDALRFVSLSRRIQQLIACPHIQSHYEPFLHNVQHHLGQCKSIC
jgi:uncharacterized NAD(P)/FAD-binding protein YdhS